MIVSGANQCLLPEEVREARAVLSGAKVVVCQLEIAPETTLAALKLAKELGGERVCSGVNSIIGLSLDSSQAFLHS